MLEGWLYLAVILDLSSRRVVGWAGSENNDRALALVALGRALDARKDLPAEVERRGCVRLLHRRRGSGRRRARSGCEGARTSTCLGAVQVVERARRCTRSFLAPRRCAG